MIAQLREQNNADEFYLQFNGKKFNSLEVGICYAHSLSHNAPAGSVSSCFRAIVGILRCEERGVRFPRTEPNRTANVSSVFR